VSSLPDKDFDQLKELIAEEEQRRKPEPSLAVVIFVGSGNYELFAPGSLTVAELKERVEEELFCVKGEEVRKNGFIVTIQKIVRLRSRFLLMSRRRNQTW
jgi:hypothetical protein